MSDHRLAAVFCYHAANAAEHACRYPASSRAYAMDCALYAERAQSHADDATFSLTPPPGAVHSTGSGAPPS